MQTESPFGAALNAFIDSIGHSEKSECLRLPEIRRSHFPFNVAILPVPQTRIPVLQLGNFIQIDCDSMGRADVIGATQMKFPLFSHWSVNGRAVRC
jgi:hypothetical protein